MFDMEPCSAVHADGGGCGGMVITANRIVSYRLNEDDVARINYNRAALRALGIRDWYEAQVGDVCPLLVVRVRPNWYGTGVPGVNGQVSLDGLDGLWVTVRREGDGNGEWFWPPRE